MPPFFDILMYYLIGAVVPCNLLFGFTMQQKTMAYVDVPAVLFRKYGRNALVLLPQAFVATILLAQESWQLNLLLAIESAIFGIYERRLLLSWLTNSGRSDGRQSLPLSP